MKLEFSGHNETYAVEQSLLALFPGERPVYEPITPGEPAWAKLTLSEGPVLCTARTELCYGGITGVGISRCRLSQDDYTREGERRRLLELSFFKAARSVTGATPPWGSLIGVRPDKIAVRALEAGKTPAQTDRLLRDTYYVTSSRRRLALETASAGLAARRDLGPRDIAVYVGIPFCPTRCAYCSFVSASVEKTFAQVAPYVDALIEETRSAGRMSRELGLRVRAFYMGGGTPTTLTAEQMDRLLSAVEESFDLSPCGEQTIEAGRPDTITAEKLDVLKRHGTTRVSVNPQTMEDDVLFAIGRRHTAAEIDRAMELVAAAGFQHVNMDLIAGLPADTADGFRRSLDRCLTMGADNITVHTLSLKKGSGILSGGISIPSAEAVGEMLSYADPVLRAHGYGPYYLYRQKYMSGSFENVGWCQSGTECLYNIYIMSELCSILSLGAGGSTKMVDSGKNRISRVFNLKYPHEYAARPEKWQSNQAAFAAFYQSKGVNI